MEKQMTAVEWLIKQIDDNGFIKFATNEQIEQAKVMEEEQRVESYKNGYINGQMDAYTK